jgi:hypothetical protein
MTNEMYRRIHELEKVLALHFSDLGIVIDFQTDMKKIAIWEPLPVCMESVQEMVSMPSPKYGALITIQLKFKPF